MISVDRGIPFGILFGENPFNLELEMEREMEPKFSVEKRNLYVVSVIGEDQVGIVSKVTQFLFRKGVNIVDVEQTVIHSKFTMVLLVEPLRPRFHSSQLKKGFHLLAQSLKMTITMTPFHEFKGLRLAEAKKPYVLTILGPDRAGIVAAFSSVLAKNRCNIERIKMIARGELLAMEMWFDIRDANFSGLRSDLTQVAQRIGMDIIAQPERTFQKRKKVIVFDMDSTIVDGEIIDEMAEQAGVGEKVAELTARGMRGEIDFAQSLRKRVALLRGLRMKSLESFARTIRLTKGSEELIGALKEMGFKVALISGGFSYFTDILKERLGFDYAYGNKLEVKGEKLTGRITGRIIDAKGKAAILDQICRLEGITRDEVVAVGDGSNDRIMVANAGLGIAFNAKEVLKKVADGAITQDHMKGILYCLGISDFVLKRRV